MALEKTIKVFSIIAVVIGSFTLLFSLTDLSDPDAGYAIMGGGFFLAIGWMNLVYISKRNR